MINKEITGVELVKELLDQVTNVKWSTTLLQQTFATFKILNNDVLGLKLNNDRVNSDAELDKTKTDILALKSEIAEMVLATDLDARRKDAIGTIQKELDKVLLSLDRKLVMV